jgi:hypothetical protein
LPEHGRSAEAGVKVTEEHGVDIERKDVLALAEEG